MFLPRKVLLPPQLRAGGSKTVLMSMFDVCEAKMFTWLCAVLDHGGSRKGSEGHGEKPVDGRDILEYWVQKYL